MTMFSVQASVALGMLRMPFVRRARAAWVRVLLGVTVGLLASFLALDATLEAVDMVTGKSSSGGPRVVFLGAAAAYLVLEGTDAAMRRQKSRAPLTTQAASPTPQAALMRPRRLALLPAIGIGTHNLGEGRRCGAVAQVAVKLLPMFKDRTGKTFTALTSTGVILGMAVMFATGLLVQA
jgi:hypothetical protein